MNGGRGEGMGRWACFVFSLNGGVRLSPYHLIGQGGRPGYGESLPLPLLTTGEGKKSRKKIEFFWVPFGAKTSDTPEKKIWGPRVLAGGGPSEEGQKLGHIGW